MNTRTKSIQIAAVAGFVILAILGLVQSIRRETGVPEFVPLPIPKFQLNVILQEAAYPGRVIHVNEHGSEVLTYKCQPEDAAIAVFTLRNLTTGENTPPQTMNAKDPEGHSFLATYFTKGGINVLAIRAGFAKRPSSIIIPQNGGYRISDPSQNIVITKIAEPKRALTTPTPAELANAEKFATATVYEDGWGVEFKEKEPKKPNEFVDEKILATSFSPVPPFSTETLVDGSNRDANLTYFSRGVDVIKVQFDRYRSSFKPATIKFKGAQIIHRNGSNLLWFPRDSQGTSIEGLESVATNLGPLPREGKVPKHPVSNGGMTIKLTNPPGQPNSKDPKMPDKFFQVTGVTPEVAALGLDSLRIKINHLAPSNTERSAFVSADEEVFKAKSSPQSVTSVDVPEITVHLKIITQVKVSSRIVVLPVHYAKRKSTAK